MGLARRVHAEESRNQRIAPNTANDLALAQAFQDHDGNTPPHSRERQGAPSDFGDSMELVGSGS